MSGRAAGVRVVAGLVTGAAVAVVPYVYYWRLDWHQLQTTGVRYLAVLAGPVVAAGFAATLIGHRRPRWWLGALLGFALGLVTGILFLRAAGDVPQEWWALVLLGALMAVSGGMGGAVGGLLGWVVSRALTPAAPDGAVVAAPDGAALTTPGGATSKADPRVRPWHVGAAVAVAMILVFGVLAAVG